jgi:hypothetical protein
VLILWEKLVGERALNLISQLTTETVRKCGSCLKSSSKAVDTVVCLLLRKTLQSKEDSLGLFGDQIIGPVAYSISAQFRKAFIYISKRLQFVPTTFAYPWEMCIPQPELPVSSSIGVPVGQWRHPPLEPWSLYNVTRERWLRHVAVVKASRNEALW